MQSKTVTIFSFSCLRRVYENWYTDCAIHINYHMVKQFSRYKQTLELNPKIPYTQEMGKEGTKLIAQNKKARFNYSIEESIECGIVLEGTEVKSVKEGNFSFPDAFAEIVNNEVWVKQLHISEYVYSSVFNHDPDRPKKLLLHKDEIKRLKRKVEEKGITLIPLDFFLKNGLVKVNLGLCKGKKLFDKRADIRDRDVKRDLQREFRKRIDG